MATPAEQAAVLARPEWQPDEDAAYCPKCENVFGFFLRKHHCRMCGLVFCNECTSNRLECPPEFGYSGPQRMCFSCFSKGIREQEVQRSRKDELITVQFYLRDSKAYRVKSREITDMGHRSAPEKTPSTVEFKDEATGNKVCQGNFYSRACGGYACDVAVSRRELKSLLLRLTGWVLGGTHIDII